MKTQITKRFQPLSSPLTETNSWWCTFLVTIASDEYVYVKELELKLFRLISLSEGISYLLILSVTFGFISRDYVSGLGMAHGILFIAYTMLSLDVRSKQNWSTIVWLLVFLASLIPFSFIVIELFLRRESAASSVANQYEVSN